jgi:formate-dependent nitrite reductase membrane component NrfD
MLATDFFLGGLGGGILVSGALMELAFGAGTVSPFAFLVGAACVAMGSLLLIMELGRPLRALRVFVNLRSTLTKGAWLMVLAIGCGLIYASFSAPVFPWVGIAWLRVAFAAFTLVFATGVFVYPGIFLGKMQARPFWSGPGLSVLFILSALANGLAAQLLLGAIWPLGVSAIVPASRWILAGLVLVQAGAWLLYFFVKGQAGSQHEKDATRAALAGAGAFSFWGGAFLVGLLLPFVLYMTASSGLWLGASALVVFGAWVMRMFVIHSDDRTWLPGEKQFLAKVAQENADFFSAWNY